MSQKQNVTPILYCICRSSKNSGFMIACDNCQEWYHGECVNVTEEFGTQLKNYYCESCRDDNPDLKLVRKEVRQKKRHRHGPMATCTSTAGTTKTGTKSKLQQRMKGTISHANMKHVESGRVSVKRRGRPLSASSILIKPNPYVNVTDLAWETENRSAGADGLNSTSIPIMFNSEYASSSSSKPKDIDVETLRQKAEAAIRTGFWVSNTSSNFDPSNNSKSPPLQLMTEQIHKRRNEEGIPSTAIKKPKTVKNKVTEELITVHVHNLREFASEFLSNDTFLVPNELDEGKDACSTSSSLSVESIVTDTGSESERHNLLDLKLKSSVTGERLPSMCSTSGCYHTATRTRSGSHFCSDKCYEITSHLQLREFIKQFPRPPTVNCDNACLSEAEEIEKFKELSLVRLWMNGCHENLQLLGRRKLGLDCYLNFMKFKEDCNTTAFVEEQITYRCIICCYKYKLGKFWNHLKHCVKQFQKRHDPYQMRDLVLIARPSIWCGKPLSSRLPTQGSFCKKLKVLCDRHNLEITTSKCQNKVCGYPFHSSNLLEMDFETFDWAFNKSNNGHSYCRQPKTACSQHGNWETAIYADLDTRRLVQTCVIHDLKKREQILWMCLANKKPWLKMLLS